MPESIVSFTTMQRRAGESCAARARCPGEARGAPVRCLSEAGVARQRRPAEAAAADQFSCTACPWPPESAAGQAFQLEFHSQRALLEAALCQSGNAHG